MSADIMSSDKKCSRHVFLQRKDILTTSSSCSTTLERQEVSADISCRRGCRPTAQRRRYAVGRQSNDIHDDRKCLQTFFVAPGVVQQPDDVFQLSSNSSTTSQQFIMDEIIDFVIANIYTVMGKS